MKKVAILFIVLLTSSFIFAQNTYVPDDKFEQALIDLGYDTTLDDYVLTANISGVTTLDVDGKEISDYAFDTPCTYAVQFTIVNNRLDMCVTMRSNDLWYGFCNDQYQFSKLQETVSERLEIETGVYYHFAHNMHLYNNKI